MSSMEKNQPRRWVPTYAILLLSLVILSVAFIFLYLRTGSDTYLSGAILIAMVAVYAGWSFARLLSMRPAPRFVFTQLKCSACSYEVTREYKEGDKLFSEADQCPKCGGKMIVEGIFLRSARQERRTV